MKGLTNPPTVAELQLAYSRLQTQRGDVSEAELATWSQWARFDPRLGEQWVAHLAAQWELLRPALFGECLRALPWPAAAGVLLEQVREFKLPRSRRAAFGAWSACALMGIAPAEGELFFIGLRAFGGQAMRADAERSLEIYVRWGFLGREVLVNKAPRGGRTLVGAERRRAALDSLILRNRDRGRSRLSAAEYREELQGWVSRRQSELDLAAHPGLRAVGNTKARWYQVIRRGK